MLKGVKWRNSIQKYQSNKFVRQRKKSSAWKINHKIKNHSKICNNQGQNNKIMKELIKQKSNKKKINQ